MENKYYTPSIEEFFVGFEFEHKDPCYDGREEFQKAIVESDNLVRYPDEDGMFNYWEAEHLLSNILYDVKENNIRVKYLDTSDIEELGFDRLNDLSNGVQMYKKDVYYILWQPESLKQDKGALIIEDINDVCLFRGFIKNKSELIRLLGWLNV